MLLLLAQEPAPTPAPESAQEPAPAPAQEPQPAAAEEPQVDPVEVEAFAALRKLEAALPPAPAEPDERALAVWGDEQVSRLLSFTVTYTGTEASAEAWHAIGLLRLQSEADPLPGLAAMTRAWEVLRGLDGPRPSGARLSTEGYGEYLLAMMLDHEALEGAAQVLAELRRRAGPRDALGGGPGAAAHARLDLEERRLASLRALQPGRIFPALRLPTLDGTATVALEELHGGPVLVEFHPPEAGPSPLAGASLLRDTPTLQSVLVYVGVAEERPLARQRAEANIAPQGTRLHAWMDGGLSGAPARALALRSLPRSFLLDAEGRIVARDLLGPELRARLVTAPELPGD